MNEPIDEWIECLRNPEYFQRKAIDRIRSRWSEAAEPLLEALKENIDAAYANVPDESEFDEEDPEIDFGLDELETQAALLFAEFRHKPAFPELLRLLKLPLVDVALGDFLLADLPRCLAATWSGDLDPLREIYGDPDEDEMVRAGALVVLFCLVAWGELSESVLLEELRRMLEGDVGPGDAFFKASVAMGVSRLPADSELLARARAVLTSDHVDSATFPVREFDAMRKRFPGLDWRKELLSGNEPVEDASDAIEAWFEGGEDESDDGYDQDGNWIPPEPVEQLKSEKVGRNDPCPCGSGKKHKKCCGKEG